MNDMTQPPLPLSIAGTVPTVRGMTLTPPTIGRITMGHTEVRGDKVLPSKDDHFTVTTLVQQKDRSWVEHPISKSLERANNKLVSIPVVVAFNDPALTLNNRFSAFDPKTGRVFCSGDGEFAKRRMPDGVAKIDCPRPEACEFGQRNRCRSMSRFYVRIDGQDDELGLFVLRSTSFNTLDRLATRLNMWSGLTGGRLAGLPLMLTINAKTSVMSMRTAFYFADLVQRPNLSVAETVKEARQYQKEMEDDELNQDALESAMKLGLANSDFADELEDPDEWLSDDALIAGAEAGLQRAGLKGLDSVVAKAATGDEQAKSDAPAGDVAQKPGKQKEAAAVAVEV